MLTRDLDAVFYVAHAPTIEFRDGVFLVGYDVGKCHFEFAMSPNVFLKARRLANGVIDRFHDRSGVAPIKRDKVAH